MTMTQQAAQPMSIGINRSVNAYYRLRAERARSYGFHPSEVSGYDFCAVRAYFLEEAYDQVCSSDPQQVRAGFGFIEAVQRMKANGFRPGLHSEFIIGHNIHELLQFELGVIGRLWGVWMCPHCRLLTPEGWMPRTQVADRNGEPMLDAAPCNRCRGRNYAHKLPWLYIEPSVGWTALARELGIDGHMDGDLRFFYNNVWYRYVLEIKSINDYGYSEGKHPKWETLALVDGWTPPQGWYPKNGHESRVLPLKKHVTQASLYAAVQGITHIVFMYVNKNQVSRRKELVVPIDPGALELARGKINAVNNARQNMQGPPIHARICSDVRDETARNCPASERCFGCRPPVNALEV